MQKSFSYQQGIGLVELMISITLGLFLISGAIGVLFSTKNSYNMNNDLTWIQDNARFAAATVNRDIRMAGFFGCNAESRFTSVLNPSASGSGWEIDFEKAVSGWDGDAGNYPSPEFPAAYNPNAALGMPASDIISIRRAGETEVEIVNNLPVSNVVMDVVGSHSFNGGDILIVTDCTQTTVFQHTGNGTNKLQYNTGNGNPGNCTNDLGYSTTPCSSSASYEFHGDKGARVLDIISHAYYVAEGADGSPALFRRELDGLGGGAVLNDEELVQGVENIQVVYGLDTNDNGYANRYVNANNIAAADWADVVTVRMHMLVRSFSQVASEAQTYRFAGASYTPNDRYVRQEFISTIELRNRG